MANEVDSELTSTVTDPSSGSLLGDKTTGEGDVDSSPDSSPETGGKDKDEKMRLLSSTQTRTVPHSEPGSTIKENANNSGKRERELTSTVTDPSSGSLLGDKTTGEGDVDSSPDSSPETGGKDKDEKMRLLSSTQTGTVPHSEPGSTIKENGNNSGNRGRDFLIDNKIVAASEANISKETEKARDINERGDGFKDRDKANKEMGENEDPEPMRLDADAEKDSMPSLKDKMRLLSSTQTGTVPHSEPGSTIKEDKENVSNSGKRERDNKIVAASETDISKETEKARDINERGDGFKDRDKANKEMGENEDPEPMRSDADAEKDSMPSLKDKMRLLSSTQTGTVPHSEPGSTIKEDKENVNNSGKRERDNKIVATSETTISKETEKARDINERGDGFKDRDKANKEMGENEDPEPMRSDADAEKDSMPSLKDKMRLRSSQTGTVPHSEPGSTIKEDKENVSNSGNREIDNKIVAASETDISKETEKARDINERGDGFNDRDKANKEMGENEDPEPMRSDADAEKDSMPSLEESLQHKSSGFPRESQPQIRVGGNDKLFWIGAVVVVLLASVVYGTLFFSDSTPPVPKEFKVVDVFNQEMEKLKTIFPNQRPELWRRSLIHLRRHLKTEQHTEPVSLILTSGHRAERTLGCLAQCLAHAFSTARNSSVLNINGKGKASQDSDQVKLDIDSELRNAFEGKTFAAVIHRFEELPPGSTLIFYRYCDHENAAYKNVFLAFTVMLDTEVEVSSNVSLGRVEEMVQEHVTQKFVSSDKLTTFNQMDVDKLSGLWSRISHLILPVAAEEKIEHQGCGGDCGKSF